MGLSSGKSIASNGGINLVLVGCGGFALEVIQYISDLNRDKLRSAQEIRVSHILSTSFERKRDIFDLLGYEPLLVGEISEIEGWPHLSCVICVGDPVARYRIFFELKSRGGAFASIIHPAAYVAPTSRIGLGVIVAPFGFVGPSSEIHDNSVLNVRVTIGHDASIGHSSIVCPHADVNGGGQVGTASLLGAGAILDPKAAVGSFCKVASGSVVKRSFEDGFLLAGNPATGRKMFKTEFR